MCRDALRPEGEYVKCIQQPEHYSRQSVRFFTCSFQLPVSMCYFAYKVRAATVHLRPADNSDYLAPSENPNLPRSQEVYG
jgi:hypothetical protein